MLQCSNHLSNRDREEKIKRLHPMFILSFVVLSGIVAAGLTARLASSRFDEFKGLPYMSQDA